DEDWTARAQETYRSARDAAAKALQGAPVRFHLAEGGTYLFLDFTDLTGGRPVTDLLARAIDHGVMLAPGGASGRAYECHGRLWSPGVPEATVIEGIARLREAIETGR